MITTHHMTIDEFLALDTEQRLQLARDELEKQLYKIAQYTPEYFGLVYAWQVMNRQLADHTAARKKAGEFAVALQDLATTAKQAGGAAA